MTDVEDHEPPEPEPAAGADAAAGEKANSVNNRNSSSMDPTKTASATSAGPVPGHESAVKASPEPHFVQPASYLRPLVSRAPQPASAVVTAANTTSISSRAGGAGEASAVRPGSGSGSRPSTRDIFDTSTIASGRSGQMITSTDREQSDGLRAIRKFLKERTSYDVLPLSYRLIIFDTSLLVKKSLNTLIQCGIVSAPLWDSKTSTFAGLLTVSDYINVVQYYWQNPDALAQVDQFKLSNLRDVERAIGVAPPETVSIHPLRPLYEACTQMLKSRARRIPLVDVDDETQRDMVVSLVTQYRILKFVSINVKDTEKLVKPLRELGIGTYTNLQFATMDTPVIDVIHLLVKHDISCIPIVDHDLTVLNVFEAVDVIILIKGGDYENLNLSVGKALEKRSEDFPGIYTCTVNDRLDTIFDTIRKSRVHRLVIIDEAKKLKGLLSLSDILNYALNSPIPDEGAGVS